MKASYYLRARNFAAPSINDDTKTSKSWYNNNVNYDLLKNGTMACCTNNIMFDSRVCRGNTYAKPVYTEDQRRHQEIYKRTQQARRSIIEQRRMDKAKRSITPPPVWGRVHVMVQTDGTLEDIFGSDESIVIDYKSENCDEKTSIEGSGSIHSSASIAEQEEGKDDSNGMSPCNGEFADDNNPDTNHGNNENDKPTTAMEERKNRKLCHDLDSSIATTEGTECASWEDDNETLTQSLARIIYDKAKHDAMCRIEHGPLYHSDPER